MTCDLCQKNEATVHLTEVVNQQSRELHLCEPCAKEKGAEAVEQFGGQAAQQMLEPGLAELLAGLTDLSAKLPGGVAVQSVTCPNCKLTYADFRKSGRLGCGECYEAFRKILAPLLKKIHGSNQYLGKVPARPRQPKQDLTALKEQLKASIAAESFEEAARLRDRIRLMETKSKKTK